MTETRSQERERSEKDIQKDLIKAAKEIKNVILNFLPTSETSIAQWRALIEEAEKSPVTNSPKSKQLVMVAKTDLNALLDSLPGNPERAESDTGPETGAPATAEITSEDAPEASGTTEQGPTKVEVEKIEKKAEQKKSELYQRLAQAKEAMLELQKKPEGISNLTEKEVEEWKNLINETQKVLKDLTEETDELFTEVIHIFHELRDLRDNEKLKKDLKQAIEELLAILETKSVSELTSEEKKRWGALLEKAKAKNSKKHLSKEAIPLMFTLMNLLDSKKSKEAGQQNSQKSAVVAQKENTPGAEPPKGTADTTEEATPEINQYIDRVKEDSLIIFGTGTIRKVLKKIEDPSYPGGGFFLVTRYGQNKIETGKEIMTFKYIEENPFRITAIIDPGAEPETRNRLIELAGKEDSEVALVVEKIKEGSIHFSIKDTIRKIIEKKEDPIFPGGGFFRIKRRRVGQEPVEEIMTFEKLAKIPKKDIFEPGEAPELERHLTEDEPEVAQSTEDDRVTTEETEEAEAATETEEETGPENQESDRNTTLKIHNRIKLKKLLKKTLPESTTTNFLNEEVERQEEFVRVAAIENLFENSDRQELLEGLLFAEVGSPEYNKIRDLIVVAMEEAGLLVGIKTLKEKNKLAEKLIRKQRSHFLELADSELAQNSRLSKKEIAIKVGKKIGIIGAIGLTSAAVSTFLPPVSFAGLVVLGAYRVGSTYKENKAREKERDAIVAKNKEAAEKNPDEANAWLNVFFSDIAVEKQKQINEVPWMGPKSGKLSEQFFASNPEMLENYEEEEKESLIASLKALEEINELNNEREKNFLKKKLDSIIEDIPPEVQAVRIATSTAISIMVRTIPGVRHAFFALAGWRAGAVIGNLIHGKEAGGKIEVTLEDHADEVLQKLEELRKKREAGQKLANKKMYWRVGGILVGAFLGELIAPNEAMAVTEEASGVGAPPETGTGSGVSGPTVEASTERIMKPGVPKYDFEGIPGVASGMPGEGTYTAPGGGEAGEEILNQKVAEVGMDRSSGGYGQETPRGGSGGGNNAGEAENLTTAPGATPTTRGGIEEMTGKSGSEKMSEVDGKNARHLWGLIEGKVNAAIGESYGDIKGSEGRMTYIVDAIKDRVAENPEEFGLPKGTNIDVLSKEQLLTLASSDEFDSQLAELLTDEDHGLIKAAESLDESAVRNIESNNEFYRQNVSRLDDSGGLGQADYDLMDKMKSEAGQAAAQQTVTPATGVPEVGAEEITAQAVPEVTSELTDEAARQVAESSGSETYSANEYATAEEAAAAGKTWIPNDGATPSVDAETELPITEAEVNDKKTEAWMDLLTKFKANEDNREVVRSLENVFRQSGIEDTYDSEYHSPFFVKGLRRVSDYLSGREILTFQTPYPAEAEDANALGDLRFEYDPTSNYLRVFDGSQWFGERLNNEMTLPKKIEAIFEEIKNSRQ